MELARAMKVELLSLFLLLQLLSQLLHLLLLSLPLFLLPLCYGLFDALFSSPLGTLASTREYPWVCSAWKYLFATRCVCVPTTTLPPPIRQQTGERRARDERQEEVYCGEGGCKKSLFLLPSPSLSHSPRTQRSNGKRN